MHATEFACLGNTVITIVVHVSSLGQISASGVRKQKHSSSAVMHPCWHGGHGFDTLTG